MKLFVKMRGGLGNQMFQFSYAYLISRDWKNSEIIFDIRSYNDYYWPFSLTDFNLDINYSIAPNKKQKYDLAISKFHIFQKLYHVFSGRYFTNFRKKDLKKKHLFTGIYCDRPLITFGDYVLFGYFENADILIPVRNDLCRLFTFDSDKTRFYISKLESDPILVSIRILSDKEEKQKKKENKLQNKSFYFECLRKINDNQKRQIVVMSNNVEKVKKEYQLELKFSNVLYIENCSANEQMEIMKHCKDFVISNSTFSWWGSFMGSYLNEGHVYAPKTWYKKTNINDTKLFFKEMIIVDFE